MGRNNLNRVELIPIVQPKEPQLNIPDGNKEGLLFDLNRVRLPVSDGKMPKKRLSDYLNYNPFHEPVPEATVRKSTILNPQNNPDIYLAPTLKENHKPRKRDEIPLDLMQISYENSTIGVPLSKISLGSNSTINAKHAFFKNTPKKAIIPKISHPLIEEFIKPDSFRPDKVKTLAYVPGIKLSIPPYPNGENEKTITFYEKNIKRFTTPNGAYGKASHIGTGASAHVYKVYDEKNGEWVAVKVYTNEERARAMSQVSRGGISGNELGKKLAGYEGDRHNFAREIIMLRRLSKDSSLILPEFKDESLIYDPQLKEWIPFFVMDLVPGQSLDNQKSFLSVPVSDKLQILLSAFSGIQNLHENYSCIHRDLKPSAIMFDKSAASIKVGTKIIDIGAIMDLTKDENLINFYTPLYAPPEVVQCFFKQGNAKYSFQSDIFSLGMVTLQVLGNLSKKEMIILTEYESRNSFKGTNPDILQRVQQNIQQVRLFDQGTYSLFPSQALAEVVGKSIAYDPDNRYKSINELIQASEELIPIINLFSEHAALMEKIDSAKPFSLFEDFKNIFNKTDHILNNAALFQNSFILNDVFNVAVHSFNVFVNSGYIQFDDLAMNANDNPLSFAFESFEKMFTNIDRNDVAKFDPKTVIHFIDTLAYLENLQIPLSTKTRIQARIKSLQNPLQN